MTPKHPVGPAFDQASDKVAAWRKQQEKLLSEEQRKEYNRMQRLQNEKLRAHEEKFQDELHDRINEEKRKLLLHKPEPALRMLPGRPLKERRAEYLATQNVSARHEAERRGIEEEFQQERDGYLHGAEVARQREGRDKEAEKAAPDLTAALMARAARKERMRGDEGRELGR